MLDCFQISYVRQMCLVSTSVFSKIVSSRRSSITAAMHKQCWESLVFQLFYHWKLSCDTSLLFKLLNAERYKVKLQVMNIDDYLSRRAKHNYLLTFEHSSRIHKSSRKTSIASGVGPAASTYYFRHLSGGVWVYKEVGCAQLTCLWMCFLIRLWFPPYWIWARYWIKSMFSNSSNLIMNGTFTNVQGRGLNGKLINYYHSIKED